MTTKLVKMKVDFSRTVNLGNYESVKVSAGLERMVEDDPETLEKEWYNMLSWAETRVEEECQNLK